MLRTLEAFKASLDEGGPDAVMAFLNQGVEHRYTAAYRFDGDLLRNVQLSVDVPSFGLCRTCRFHRTQDGLPFCGLTEEPLAAGDEVLICREHRNPA